MKTHNIKFEEKDRVRFKEIKDGIKKVETRATNEKYDSIREGDKILFTCGKDSFYKRIKKIYHWPTIEAMFTEVPIEKIMPGLITIEEVRSRYATYPGYTERIQRGGILGFELI